MPRMLLAFALLIAGCAGGGATPEVETAPATGGALSPEVGETVAIEGGPRLTFLEVVSDNRCPVDVQCIVAGEAVVRLAVALQGRRTEVTVMIPGLVPDDYPAAEVFANGARALGYQIGLMALRPYPGSPEAADGAAVDAVLAVRPGP